MIMEKESPEEFGYDRIKYNLTESSVADLKLSEIINPSLLSEVLLSYGDHKGYLQLREEIAKNYNGLNPNNILVATGACMALFIVNATILSPGDKILVMGPNYAANFEVPRSLGVNVEFIPVSFQKHFTITLEDVVKHYKSDVKLISITVPHNPTGTIIEKEEFLKIIHFAKSKRCYILVDETYRELTFGEKLPLAATIDDYAISVESLSKAYGIPGIRIGWIATQNKELIEKFLATKEQICICNSILDEYIAAHVLKNKDKILPQIIEANRLKFDLVKKWIKNEPRLEWVEPKGGVVLFPRIKEDANINILKFYEVLNNMGTFVGPGHWFEMPDSYMRIGYAWMPIEKLKEALKTISNALDQSKN